MWQCHPSSFPQTESSSSFTTTPFPGNQSGFGSANSSGQGNSAGSLSYSTQAPDYRFFQQGLNWSGDGLPYGSVHDFRNGYTSSNASIQHSTPQHSFQQGANYNQSEEACPTLLFGATSNIATRTMSLRTDPTGHESTLQNQQLHQIDPQDFSLVALETRQSFPGWDHSTIYNEDHGFSGQGLSDATSRQPDMRYNTSWQSSCPVSGQRSFNSTLRQPDSSPMGVGLPGVIQGQPDTTLGTISQAGQNDFNTTESYYPSTNTTKGFSHISSVYGRTSSLQHPINQSSVTANNKNWMAFSAKAKDNCVIEDFDALEHVVGQNDKLYWNRTNLTTVGSIEARPVNYQRQQSLNTTICLPGDIQDLTTTSSQSQETCTSEEVRHQVAFSQSPAASGLQPWVSAAPPASRCVQQQGLSSFDTTATGALSGFPFTRSPSIELGVGHSGGENRGIEREASGSSFLSAESGTPGEALFHTLRHLNASVNSPESIEWPTVVLNDKAPGAEKMGVGHDFFTEFSNNPCQLKNLIRSCDGRPPHVCKLCQYVANNLYKMKIHLRIHTGEKPYTCSHCGKAFSQSQNRTVHERIHTGVKPYTCQYCPKAFYHPSNLRSHEQTHRDKGPILAWFA